MRLTIVSKNGARFRIAADVRQGGTIRRFLWRLCVRAIFRLSRREAVQTKTCVFAVNVDKKPVQKGAVVALAEKNPDAWRWN